VLKRAENVEPYYQRDVWGLLSGRYKVLLVAGRRQHLSSYRVSKAEFRRLAADSAVHPVPYLSVGERTYWRFQDRWYTDNEGLNSDEVYALLIAREQRKQTTLNRAKTVAALVDAPAPTARTGVSTEVKQLVWTRDGGACRACGSNAELQFDHIIPLAMGGSNDEGNIQILCGPCNRRKGASIV
jgi:hypothetical protein